MDCDLADPVQVIVQVVVADKRNLIQSLESEDLDVFVIDVESVQNAVHDVVALVLDVEVFLAVGQCADQRRERQLRDLQIL